MGDGTTQIARLRTFGDMVAAVATGALVLAIQLPDGAIPPGELHDQIGNKVGEMLGFGVGFVAVGVLWAQHHRALGRVARCDEPFLALNLLFLLGIAFLPYPAGVLGRSPDAEVAVLLFGGSTLVVALIWTALWLYASAGGRLTLREGGSVEGRAGRAWDRAMLRRSLLTAGAVAVSLPFTPVVFGVERIGGFSLATAILVVAMPLAQFAPLGSRRSRRAGG